MKKKDATAYFGTATKLATSLSISKQSVSKWGIEIPQRRAFELERITNGALKADFSPGVLNNKSARG